MYRLAWEARNAELSRQDKSHQYVQLVPVKELRNGQFLSRVEEEGIDLVKSSRVALAREQFARVRRRPPCAPTPPADR